MTVNPSRRDGVTELRGFPRRLAEGVSQPPWSWRAGAVAVGIWYWGVEALGKAFMRFLPGGWDAAMQYTRRRRTKVGDSYGVRRQSEASPALRLETARTLMMEFGRSRCSHPKRCDSRPGEIATAVQTLRDVGSTSLLGEALGERRISPLLPR
jgi:hypothetical protein